MVPILVTTTNWRKGVWSLVVHTQEKINSSLFVGICRHVKILWVRGKHSLHKPSKELV